jgi:hypothetical protein
MKNALDRYTSFSKIFILIALSLLINGCLDKTVKLEEVSSWQVVEGFK